MGEHRVGKRETGAKSCFVRVFRMHDAVSRNVRDAMNKLGAVIVDTVPSSAVGYLWEDTYRVPIKWTLAQTERYLRSRKINGIVYFSERKGRVCGKVNPIATGQTKEPGSHSEDRHH